MEFSRAFPALMLDGSPLSWRHFVYGLSHLSRAGARESVRLAAAVRVGQAEKDDFKAWLKPQLVSAGWANG